MKEKQKKLKEMRYHQVQSTPFVQPTVDQTLLAAAIAQAQAMGGAAVNPVFPVLPVLVNPVGTSASLNLNHLLNPLHMRVTGSVMKQPKFSGHANYWASFERQFMVWLQAEKLDKELWILGLMDCLTGKLRESTYNLYVERQNQGDPRTHDELWRALKKRALNSLTIITGTASRISGRSRSCFWKRSKLQGNIGSFWCRKRRALEKAFLKAE